VLQLLIVQSWLNSSIEISGTNVRNFGTVPGMFKGFLAQTALHGVVLGFRRP